jgi:hypothetical protein
LPPLYDPLKKIAPRGDYEGLPCLLYKDLW